MKEKPGLAGKVAHAFIHSKLTPLIIAASILLGVGAVLMLPREEEPQIIVPMIDIFVQMPGGFGQGGGGAGHEAHGTTPLGNPGGGVHLLHVLPRLFHGRCPVLGG